MSNFGTVPDANFDTFSRSLMSVMQLITQDNWTDILFNCIRTTNTA